MYFMNNLFSSIWNTSLMFPIYIVEITCFICMIQDYFMLSCSSEAN